MMVNFIFSNCHKPLLIDHTTTLTFLTRQLPSSSILLLYLRAWVISLSTFILWSSYSHFFDCRKSFCWFTLDECSWLLFKNEFLWDARSDGFLSIFLRASVIIVCLRVYFITTDLVRPSSILFIFLHLQSWRLADLVLKRSRKLVLVLCMCSASSINLLFSLFYHNFFFLSSTSELDLKWAPMLLMILIYFSWQMSSCFSKVLHIWLEWGLKIYSFFLSTRADLILSSLPECLEKSLSYMMRLFSTSASCISIFFFTASLYKGATEVWDLCFFVTCSFLLSQYSFISPWAALNSSHLLRKSAFSASLCFWVVFEALSSLNFSCFTILSSSSFLFF